MNIPALRDNSIGLLRDLIGFDTTSRNSNLALIDYLDAHFKACGIETVRLHNAEATKANLLARLGPAADGGYMLSGHTDVVPVDGQQWDTPPFELTEKDGKLFGRGTADMKSFLAISLAMIPYMQQLKLRKPIYFAFSYDEEVGCLGAPDIARYIEAQNITPELAIIGEPTSMRVVNAHKGIVSYVTTVTGLEAHSSNTHKGVNAVMIAASLIHALGELAEEYKTIHCDARFDPPYSTIHVGVVNGGTARNIIPRECIFQWEIRSLKEADIDRIMSRFEAICANYLPAMKALHADADIRTVRMSHNPALEPDEDMTSEHLLMHLTDTNQIHAVSFYTEAGIFNHHGIPSIICGPGSIEQAHKPNEFIDIEQIDACIALLQKLTAKLT